MTQGVREPGEILPEAERIGQAAPSAEAMKAARKISVQFGAETTGSQIDDTYIKIAYSLDAFADRRVAEARRAAIEDFVKIAEQFVPYCGSNVQPAVRSVLEQTRRALAEEKPE